MTYTDNVTATLTRGESIEIGLPALEVARRNGLPETAGRLCALLSIMAQLEDTCVLYRGGLKGAAAVKNGARAVLAAGGPGSEAGDVELQRFDRELIRRNLSPGGSADLLAATLFLHSLKSLEEIYGAN